MTKGEAKPTIAAVNESLFEEPCRAARAGE
jgi:hypothetical protein